MAETSDKAQGMVEQQAGVKTTRLGKFVFSPPLREELGNVKTRLDELMSENEVQKTVHAEEMATLREDNHVLKEEVERLKGEMEEMRGKFVMLARLVARKCGTNPHSTFSTPTAKWIFVGLESSPNCRRSCHPRERWAVLVSQAGCPSEVELPKQERPRQPRSRKRRNRCKAKRVAQSPSHTDEEGVGTQQKADGNGSHGQERGPRRRGRFRGNFDRGGHLWQLTERVCQLASLVANGLKLLDKKQADRREKIDKPGIATGSRGKKGGSQPQWRPREAPVKSRQLEATGRCRVEWGRVSPHLSFAPRSPNDFGVVGCPFEVQWTSREALRGLLCIGVPLSGRDLAWDMKTSLEGIAWHGLREACMSWHGKGGRKLHGQLERVHVKLAFAWHEWDVKLSQMKFTWAMQFEDQVLRQNEKHMGLVEDMWRLECSSQLLPDGPVAVPSASQLPPTGPWQCPVPPSCPDGPVAVPSASQLPPTSPWQCPVPPSCPRRARGSAQCLPVAPTGPWQCPVPPSCSLRLARGSAQFLPVAPDRPVAVPSASQLLRLARGSAQCLPVAVGPVAVPSSSQLLPDGPVAVPSASQLPPTGRGSASSSQLPPDGPVAVPSASQLPPTGPWQCPVLPVAPTGPWHCPTPPGALAPGGRLLFTHLMQNEAIIGTGCSFIP
ncbi:hypothetical protein GH714_043977 [Hevea brasiliensis]|uniref:Uncharacterized protein n=1 Tax=Hevea brasiliensis TaxID=3981 RepID=A0A6A6K2K6_HEVBR|nr:hypothetical protein GH714_043977 [Hevea brasiliensis]